MSLDRKVNVRSHKYISCKKNQKKGIVSKTHGNKKARIDGNFMGVRTTRGVKRKGKSNQKFRKVWREIEGECWLLKCQVTIKLVVGMSM